MGVGREEGREGMDKDCLKYQISLLPLAFSSNYALKCTCGAATGAAQLYPSLLLTPAIAVSNYNRTAA